MKKLLVLFAFLFMAAIGHASGACTDTIKPANPYIFVGSSITLSNAISGTWSSSNSAIAIIGSSTGVLTPVTVGTVSITHNHGSGCTSTQIFTIHGANGPGYVLNKGTIGATYVTINNNDYKRASIAVTYTNIPGDTIIGIYNIYTGNLIVPPTTDTNYVYGDSTFRRVNNASVLQTWLRTNAY